MERLDETIERILCSDPYGNRPAGPTHEASRRVLGRRRAVATGAADRHVRRKRARLRHRGDGQPWADGACPSQGDRRTLMAVRHPDIYGRALHGRRADDWATDDLRQPATSSVCSFDSTRTERTASTCSAGRNSSACSSTATGTTWSATAAVAHGEPIPSTRGLAGAGHQAVPGQLVALNVVLVGGVGTGKTHLAIALGMACCQHDYRVRFLTAGCFRHQVLVKRA